MGIRRTPRWLLLLALPLCVALCVGVAGGLWLLRADRGMPRDLPGGALGLSRYVATGTFTLPVNEASAVTWSRDSDTLFVLGDAGDAVVELSRDGRVRSRMSLEGFEDTEGLTHAGGTRFFLAEERMQDVFALEYVADTQVRRATLDGWSVGPAVGNRGLEDISFDPASGGLVGVKERSPQGVYAIALGQAPTARVDDAFRASRLGLGDLSGIQVLSNVASLQGTPAARHLLVLSQESSRLLEVDPTGRVLDALSLAFFSREAEGVTVDAAGTIYVVGESSTFSDGSALLVLERRAP